MNKVTSEPDSGEEEIQTPPTPVTPETKPNNSSASNQGGHEEIDTGGTPPQGAEEGGQTETEKKAVGKLKQTQESLKQLQEKYRSVAGWIASDPDRYKEALIQTSGLTEEEAEQKVAYLRQQYSSPTGGQGGGQMPPQQQGGQYVDPDEATAARYLLEEKTAELREMRSVIQDFVNDHSGEMSPGMINAVAAMAGELHRSSKGQLTPKEALDLAYKRNFKYDELLEKAKEEGELDGLAAASSTSSSTMTSPTGNRPKKKDSEPHVPEEEWEKAQELGFESKEEYIIYRDNPVVGV